MSCLDLPIACDSSVDNDLGNVRTFGQVQQFEKKQAKVQAPSKFLETGNGT